MKQYKGYSDEELKEEIREQIRKERIQKAENIRLQQLRAEVEVEELWDLYDPQKKNRENLKRWLNEWCSGNYESYLADVEKFRLPSISVQCQHSPDLYERNYDNVYSIYGYRSKADIRNGKKDSILAIGIVAASIALLVGIVMWLV